jgi:predicted dehydrogenase
MNSRQSRRAFIKKAAGTSVLSGMIAHSAKSHRLISEPHPWTQRTFAANDQIQIATIGMGIMGFNNLEHTLKVPGVKLVAACDLYSGRLDRTKEVYGKDIYVTKNYLELLDRKDIDAVIISTSDHWHDHMAIAALKKGKHVYVEKPMVHKLDEGAALIDAQKKSGKVLQVGSQRVSSVVTLKTKELFEKKLIGDLMLVETWNDRHSANGAWQYSIPTDAKNNTVDWDRFLGDAPKQAYDPLRFFRWRNYQDYGTGIGGDLFVHLFSALHTITSSEGPVRAYATGGLRYWKDGRDVPDIIVGLYDYPETKNHSAFNLQMRVNFVDGKGGGEMLRIVGTEGVIEMDWDQVTLKRNRLSAAPGYGGWDSFETFSAGQQKEYEAWYNQNYQQEKEVPQETITWKAPENYNTNVDHHLAWYAGIREGKPIVEDALFGMRAAGPALLANKSIMEKKIIHWDPTGAKLA